MQAKFYEVGAVTVVEINGRIEPDQNKPFRDICEQKLKDRKVVFCLNGLAFTASANITTFFESINIIPEAKVVGLQHDFYKLLELKGMQMKTYSSLSDAMSSELNAADSGAKNSLNLLGLKKD